MATPSKPMEADIVPRRGRPRDEVARSRILQAALEVLENTCFANATTDAIAERAGASKATIYRWWPNKAAVLIEALREDTEHELPFPDTGNLAQDIRLQLQNFVKLLNGRRGRTFKAFVAAAQSDGEVAEAFRNVWIKPRRAQTRGILEKHQRAGRLSSGIDPDVVLDLIYGPLYFRILSAYAPLTAEFADEVASLALQGLTPQNGAGSSSSPIG